MEQWLIHLIQTHAVLVYGVIILISFVEGPILAVFCGILVHVGDIPLVPIYIALMVGDLIGDVVWYSIGYFYGHRFIRRFGKYFSITEKEVAVVDKIFHTHKNYILIISKITMGFGFALVTLVTAGMVKIPFKRYLILNVLGQLVWTAILLAIGYGFGGVYQQLDGIFAKISVIALALLLTAGLFGYGKYIKKRMTAKNS
ncbi:MAG: DedA family protein [Patescibacteria group bacterium]